MTDQELCRVGRAMFGYGWQAKLAKLLAVHPMSVSRWATGKTRVPDRVEEVLKAVRVAEIPSPEWIVGEDIHTGEDYVLHLKLPRFRARIAGAEELMPGYSLAVTEGSQVGCLEWLDLPLPREQEAKWLTEAARAVLEFGARGD